ncbi:3-deoxy-7-phosphoheptulonate synthase [Desulfobacterales bacterium HSG17]|nr:3-deoxy-7-phosphoheptulonate synthase [Desulfobacterales bacterium HSG17]
MNYAETYDKAVALRQKNISPALPIQGFHLLKSPVEKLTIENLTVEKLTGINAGKIIAKKTELKYIKASEKFLPLITPAKLKQEIPLTRAAKQAVDLARTGIEKILQKQDKRILVITGPCSIHDEKAALEYAENLKELKKKVEETLLIVMRVYFEKPRTSLGWKGMISDPHMNNSFDMTTGLKKARKLLLKINEMGIPVATEMLEPTTPAYIADLISWSAIGARTTESQTHREMASGLPMPVGFKNSTDGGLKTAINAIKAAGSNQSFLGIDQNGRSNIVRTNGNPWGHIVLRGGKHPNYDFASIESLQNNLKQSNLHEAIVVDCSHGNSCKNYKRQCIAWKEVMRQRKAGNKNIVGLMLESHLFEGNQKISSNLSNQANQFKQANLEYGVSVTDACIGWQETEKLILSADKMLKEV